MWEQPGRLAALAQKETKGIQAQRRPLLWQALQQAQQVQPHLYRTKAQRLRHRLDLQFLGVMLAKQEQRAHRAQRATKETPAALQQ
jgi:hypothetical protein